MAARSKGAEGRGASDMVKAVQDSRSDNADIHTCRMASEGIACRDCDCVVHAFGKPLMQGNWTGGCDRLADMASASEWWSP